MEDLECIYGNIEVCVWCVDNIFISGKYRCTNALCHEECNLSLDDKFLEEFKRKSW